MHALKDRSGRSIRQWFQAIAASLLVLAGNCLGAADIPPTLVTLDLAPDPGTSAQFGRRLRHAGVRTHRFLLHAVLRRGGG
ncbi:MAG: hypothetical protein V9H26_00380 [Verrucomicrobiota bacterium]